MRGYDKWFWQQTAPMFKTPFRDMLMFGEAKIDAGPMRRAYTEFQNYKKHRHHGRLNVLRLA